MAKLLIQTSSDLPDVLVDMIWQYYDYSDITATIVNIYLQALLQKSAHTVEFKLDQTICNIEAAVQRIISTSELRRTWTQSFQLYTASLLFAFALGDSDESTGFNFLICFDNPTVNRVFTYLSTPEQNSRFFQALIDFAEGKPWTII